tara:strand:- start:63 stop:230 length:168 start_codon:yes stop_codon:yes gene_type:complete
MDRISKIFNEYVNAWEDLKKAEKKMKEGEMCSGEFFDIDWHFYEAQKNFMKELQK